MTIDATNPSRDTDLKGRTSLEGQVGPSIQQQVHRSPKVTQPVSHHPFLSLCSKLFSSSLAVTCDVLVIYYHISDSPKLS